MVSRIIEEDIKSIAEDLKADANKLSGKTLLITGGSGFIGRYLVMTVDFLNKKVLEEPCNVIVADNFITGMTGSEFDSENIRLINHNVINPLKVDDHIDFIIHAAGIASPAYYSKFMLETIDVGTIGTRNMLELAKEKDVESFMFISSSEVYGDPDPTFVPTPETYLGNVNCIGPRACYDESKRLGETLCMVYHELFGLSIKIARPFNVYGPGIKWDDFRVLPNFIYNALKGSDLPVYGEGDHTRSFCYMTDAVVEIYKILLSNFSGEVFNVGNQNDEVSVMDLAKIVTGIFDNKIGIKKVAGGAVYATANPKRRCPDLNKLGRMIGYYPRIDLKAGLLRTIQWFEEEYRIQIQETVGS